VNKDLETKVGKSKNTKLGFFFVSFVLILYDNIKKKKKEKPNISINIFEI
jgi:hypothetical protein